MKEPAGYRVQTVERAGQVLAALGAADRPQTLSAIAAAAQLSLSTTPRLPRTLEAQGLVTWYRGEGPYGLGHRVLELAPALPWQLDLLGIGRQWLMAVRNEPGDPPALATRAGPSGRTRTRSRSTGCCRCCWRRSWPRTRRGPGRWWTPTSSGRPSGRH